MVDQIPMRDMARQVPARVSSGERVVRARTAVPVRAWIIDGRNRDIEISGRAVAWTSRAVLIQYVDDVGREGSLWWWASAVRRDEAKATRPDPVTAGSAAHAPHPILGGDGRTGRAPTR